MGGSRWDFDYLYTIMQNRKDLGISIYLPVDMQLYSQKSRTKISAVSRCVSNMDCMGLKFLDPKLR